MGIELGQCSHHSRVRHTLNIDGIDIVLLYLLKYEIECPPPVVVSVKLLMESGHLDGDQGKKHSQEYSQKRYDDCYVDSFHSFSMRFPVGPGMTG